jgi:thiamine-phosphate pyrophosphorylase
MTLKPTYNIVTPLNIVQIITNHLDLFLKECSELIENIAVASIRVRTENLNSSQLTVLFESLQKINKRQIPLLIENNLELVNKVNADGIHLTTGQKFVKEARETLGKDKIIGSFCGSSKHSGLVAAEHGANYVAFQIEKNTKEADRDILELFKWWSEFIEIPVMAEFSYGDQIPKELLGHCDFFTLGIDNWQPGNQIISLLKSSNLSISRSQIMNTSDSPLGN